MSVTLTIPVILAAGACSILLYDLVASLLCRRLGFPYKRAMFGSYALYALFAYLMVWSRAPMSGAATGAVLGFVDASAGWWISWQVGPGRLPAGQLTPERWAVVAVLVVLTGALFGMVGGAAAGRWG